MLRYITQGLLVISVAVAVLMALALIILRLLGGQLLAVQSNSMEPIFRKSDAVITLPTQSSNTHAGQIVSYHNPTGNGTTISHRVVAVDKKLNTITTQGDAQRASSKVVVASSQVTGRVVGVVSGAGKILEVMRHPAALMILVYVPAAVFVYREVQRLQSHFTQPRHKLASRD